MKPPVLDLRGAGVEVVEMRTRSRRRNLPTVLGARVRARTWPIRNLDFVARPGELWFVSANRPSRISILFRVACGMLPVDEGVASVPRRSVLIAGGRRSLLRGLSVGQSLRLLAGLSGLTDQQTDERFDAMVDLAQVRPYLHVQIDDAPFGTDRQCLWSAALHVPASLYCIEIGMRGPAPFRRLVHARLAHLAGEGAAILVRADVARTVQYYADRELGGRGLVLGKRGNRVVSEAELVAWLERPGSDRRERRQRRRSREQTDESE